MVSGRWSIGKLRDNGMGYNGGCEMKIVLAILITLIAGNAMAECYTPLTCLYGNDLGRSIEYDRQQRQIEDLQSRQREMEREQDYRDQQRREREIENDLDQWRRGRPSR